MANTSFFKRANLVITPMDFFNPKKSSEALRTLNDFLFENFKIIIHFNNFSMGYGMYMIPRIEGRDGWFIDSTKTDGSMIKGDTFDDLVYKLGAMIIGDEKLRMVTSDFKTVYVALYQVDKKELYTLGSFYRKDGHVHEKVCRSCGVKWPLVGQ